MANADKRSISTRLEEKYHGVGMIDANLTIPTQNGTMGMLVAVDSRTGEKFIWNEFGDELDVPFGILKSFKTTKKAFFKENWFLFEDKDVIAALGVEKFYEHTLGVQDIEDLFSMSPDEAKEMVSDICKAQKKLVARIAKKKFKNGEIDSRNFMAALSEGLGVELIDHIN